MGLLYGVLALTTGYLQGTRYFRAFPSIFRSPFFWIALLAFYVCSVVGLAKWRDWGRYLAIFICAGEIAMIATVEVLQIGAGRPHVIRFLVYGAEL